MMNNENTIESLKTDEELAVLSMSDKESFRFLIERFEPKLRRYARRLGIEQIGETDDLLQDVFLKVYQNLADFDTRLSFSSWIYRITHNQAMSFFRKRSVRPEGHIKNIEDKEFMQISSDLDIFKEVSIDESRYLVKEAIKSLNTKYTEIIILRYFEDKSYDEISDILKISPGTVATRISRAKALLKIFINKKEYIHE